MGIYMGTWLFGRTSGARVGGFPGGLAELNRSSDVGRRSKRYRRPKLAGGHRSVYDTHLVLTLCGLTSQKTNQRGLGLSGSVHEDVHPCFPTFV